MTTSTTLSGPDAAWLHMDRPSNHMVIVSFYELDGPIAYADLLARIGARLATFARFKERVVEHHHPFPDVHWERDPSFDLARHVTRATLPAGADDRVLRDILSERASTPLAFDRPLWDTTLFERPDGGGAFVLNRIHHALGDGFALLHVFLSLCDSPERIVLPAAVAEPPHHVLQMLAEGGEARRDAARELLREGGSVAHLVALPFDPKTPLRAPLTGTRRLAWSKPVPIEAVRAIGRATGATMNDVLVSCVAGALREEFVRRGAAPVDVRAMVPVNLRGVAHEADLGNDFSLVIAGLPVTVDDPLARLAETKYRLDEIKHSRDAIVARDLLRVMGRLPRSMEHLGVEFFAHKASLVLTNVPGPQQPLELLGRRVRRTMFWVPQSDAIGIGVSLFSYVGEVHMGITSDVACIRDPERTIANLEASFDALATAARVH